LSTVDLFASGLGLEQPRARLSGDAAAEIDADDLAVEAIRHGVIPSAAAAGLPGHCPNLRSGAPAEALHNIGLAAGARYRVKDRVCLFSMQISEDFGMVSDLELTEVVNGRDVANMPE
jgi:hypothetical protein